MATYNYTNGDGVSVLETTTPDGSSEPVSVLDDAIRQIKAYLKDPTKGPQAIIDAFSASEIGVIKMYGGTVAPALHLNCDGSEISRTDYAELFAKIGVNFGSGDGITTFNLPSASGRCPVCVGTSTADYAPSVALGQKLGAGGVLMTDDMLVEHTHSLPSGGGNARADGNTAGGTLSTTASASSSAAGTGSTPIPTIQPSFGVNFIIKYR